MPSSADEPVAQPRRHRRRRRLSGRSVVEALGVLASPAVAFFVLRLRAMAPIVIPDPAMHTIYVVDPRDFFARYSQALAATSGTREGARVGFLVPARIAYLLFGGVDGFFVFRYVLALVAVVPAYLLLRRLYGRWAGAIAVIVVMSSPVFVNAWGTDYPDAAVVSYLTGAIACLAMPCGDRRRPLWLAIAGALFTGAVWSLITAGPVVAAVLAVYAVVGLVRFRRRLWRDAAVLATSALAVTGGLMVASGLLLGPFNYLVATRRSFHYLDSAVVVAQYHSSNPRWVVLRPYLLVPAAAVGAYVVTFTKRLRDLDTAELIVGLSCGASIAAFVYLQFFNHAEVLENYYYSSSLWPGICLTFAITIAALAKPLLERLSTAWLPAALVLAVPLVYELKPQVSPFGWVWKGLVIVLIAAAAAAVARLAAATTWPSLARAGAAATAVVIASCSLILTVAPYEIHAPLFGVAPDPLPRYSTVLGGPVGNLIDQYRIATELPSFVGNATYPNEQLLMWYPPGQRGRLLEVTGVYHDSFNEMEGPPNVLTGRDQGDLYRRRPAEVLVLDPRFISLTLHVLARYKPTLLRHTVLRSGDFDVSVYLIWLGVFGHGAPPIGT